MFTGIARITYGAPYITVWYGTVVVYRRYARVPISINDFTKRLNNRPLSLAAFKCNHPGPRGVLEFVQHVMWELEEENGARSMARPAKVDVEETK